MGKINLSLFLIDQSKQNYSDYFGNSIQSCYAIEKKDDHDIIVTKTNTAVQRHILTSAVLCKLSSAASGAALSLSPRGA